MIDDYYLEIIIVAGRKMNETRQTSGCHRLFANRDCSKKKKKSTNRGKEKN